MVAEFESDLISARTREGMAVARANGRLRGRRPKLSPARETHLVMNPVDALQGKSPERGRGSAVTKPPGRVARTPHEPWPMA